MNWKTSRRHLLGGAAAVAGAAAAGVRLVLPPEAARVVHAADEEEWNGFLILPRGAPVPERVRCEGCEAAVNGIDLASAGELAARVPYSIYQLAELPAGVTASGAVLAVTEGGRPAYAHVTYETDIDAGPLGTVRANTIIISATTNFPRPFPVRATMAVDSDTEVAPEKVTVAGSAGLLTRTSAGEVLRWVERDTLYELSVEAGQGAAFAPGVAANLVRVA